MSYYCIICLAFLLIPVYGKQANGNGEIHQTNFLFIMFDDLRPELSVYGRNHMITPNFERLAKKSVVFDQSYTQVAVCNPARNSLLTGLRPDTVGTYGFESSFHPHVTFPTQLVRSGYNTASYGKIFHWEGNDRNIWNYESFENGWYDFQNNERSWMNSSTMPDKVHAEEWFRDHQFTTRAIEGLHKLVKENKYFMLGLGFKLPHLAVHVPYKYYEMYKGKEESWRLNKKELRFPLSSPEIGYRCCAEPTFYFMEEEGARPATKTIGIGPPDNINQIVSEQMHNELMIGYCAAVTFVDKQLGRLLDAVDELQLWHNLTIVLSADHGMHNGEKGIWEKWTLFDEATRVPLFIYHPLSPFQGKHFRDPVESLDIYPTIIELLLAPFDPKHVCIHGTECYPLQGKSLAPLILGDKNYKEFKKIIDVIQLPRAHHHNSRRLATNQYLNIIDNSTTMNSYQNHRSLRLFHHANPVEVDEANNTVIYKFDHNFAISQLNRCAYKSKAQEMKKLANESPHAPRQHFWFDCERNINPPDQISLLGYSMRTIDFRYTAWFHYNRVKCIPTLDVAPFEEELYDHRGETLADYTHQETINVAHKLGYEAVRRNLRENLIDFIKKKVVFKGCFE